MCETYNELLILLQNNELSMFYMNHIYILHNYFLVSILFSRYSMILMYFSLQSSIHYDKHEFI